MVCGSTVIWKSSLMLRQLSAVRAKQLWPSSIDTGAPRHLFLLDGRCKQLFRVIMKSCLITSLPAKTGCTKTVLSVHQL